MGTRTTATPAIPWGSLSNIKCRSRLRESHHASISQQAPPASSRLHAAKMHARRRYPIARDRHAPWNVHGASEQSDRLISRLSEYAKCVEQNETKERRNQQVTSEDREPAGQLFVQAYAAPRDPIERMILLGIRFMLRIFPAAAKLPRELGATTVKVDFFVVCTHCKTSSCIADGACFALNHVPNSWCATCKSCRTDYASDMVAHHRSEKRRKL